MALFNEILSGRFNRFVQKHFSMKGRANLPTLAADLGMTMVFNSGQENRYLEGWDLFAASRAIAATAAQFNSLEIRNPPASGVVAVVTVARFSSVLSDSGPSLTFVAGATTDQANLRTARGLDTRGRPASSLIVSDSQGAAVVGLGGVATVVMNLPTAAGIGVDFLNQQEIPLLPGSAIQITSGIVNQAGSQNLWWRERGLESSELT